MAQYLVTGGAGFIGSNIAERLLALGHYVRVVDNFSTGKRENIQGFIENPNFELVKGDLIDLETARKSVKGVDFILHQAAISSVSGSILDPLKATYSNIIGTLNLLIASQEEKVKRFVYASSCAIYGNSPELPKKEDLPPHPLSPYSLTKYAAESYVQLFWQIHRLPTISLRYFNVFGPNQDPKSQYAAVIPKFISILLEGERPIIYGDGNQTRDFIFVDNVVKANLLAAKAERGLGEIINIGSGKETTVNQLFRQLSEIVGANIEPEYAEARPGDILYSLADISKARKILGYTSEIKLKEGLVKTVKWYKQNKTQSR